VAAGVPSAAEIIPPASFEELREVWRAARSWPDDEATARRAFNAACKRAPADEIIEGARAWVETATRTGNERYVPSLAKWLVADSWAKSPPKRWTQPATGRRPSPHRRNGGKVDLARLALMQGGYVEDENGAMVYGGDQ
jgi:hypothetical protein